MRKFLTYLLLVSLFISCSSKMKVIKPDDFSDIYLEMFLVDEWLVVHNQNRHMLDTCMVYQPILEKYGYTVDDYVNSMSYYVSKPDEYAKIIKNTIVIANRKAAELEKERDRRAQLASEREQLLRFAPDTIFYLSGIYSDAISRRGGIRFCLDTTGGTWNFDAQQGLDTIFRGPLAIVRKVDSLAMGTIGADSLAVAEKLVVAEKKNN